jgi:PilZ domain
MLERRQLPRHSVYYGALVTFNDRNSTVNCIARNFSAAGVKVEFENSAIIPDDVDFAIARKWLVCRAQVAWRDHNSIGLAFTESREPNGVIPLEWAKKLQASDRINRQLQARLDRLSSER